VGPAHGVRNGVSLIQLSPRCGIVEPRKGSEADTGQAPIKRICGHAADPRIARNIQHRRVQICRGDMVVVVVESQVIHDQSLTVIPAGVGIQTLSPGPTGKRRKRIDDLVGRARPAQAKVEVVHLPAPASSLSAAASPAASLLHSLSRNGAKVVNEPHTHGVRIALR